MYPPIVTNSFIVYALKDYVASGEETTLSKSFALQGIRISGRAYGGLKRKRNGG
jgi:hypothetical protein